MVAKKKVGKHIRNPNGRPMRSDVVASKTISIKVTPSEYEKVIAMAKNFGDNINKLFRALVLKE